MKQNKVKAHSFWFQARMMTKPAHGGRENTITLVSVLGVYAAIGVHGLRQIKHNIHR